MKRYKAVLREATIKDKDGRYMRIGDFVLIPEYDSKSKDGFNWNKLGIAKILDISGNKITIKYTDDPKSGIDTIDISKHLVQKK